MSLRFSSNRKVPWAIVLLVLGAAGLQSSTVSAGFPIAWPAWVTALTTGVQAKPEKSPNEKEEEKKKEPPPIQIDPELQKKIDEIVQNDPVAKQQEEAAKKQQEDARKAREAARARRQAGQAQADGKNPAGVPGPESAPVAPPGPPPEIGPSLPINIPASGEESLLPPEQREYSFSIKDAPYEVLIEGVARQTGLAVLGEAPKDGKVSFVTDEQLTFDQMLGRVRMLLFRYKPHDPYWVVRHPTHLEVARVTDLYRVHPRNRMYSNVEEFRAARLPDEELALVLYTPKTGSVSALKPIRDFLPDYVRVSPLEGKNQVSIFALVSDINKYLELIDFFLGPGGGDDPRTIAKIPVEHITATDALAKLQNLSELYGAERKIGGGQVPRPGRPQEPNPLDNMPEPQVQILPDDAQKVLIIRAMQDKIDEIKSLMPLIDVDTSGPYLQPVILRLQHADPAELLGTIQAILTVSPAAAITPPQPANLQPGQPAPTGGKKSRKPKAGTGMVAQTEDIVVLPHPSEQALIVLADEPGVARVRQLVETFDVPAEVGPLRLPVTQADAADVVAMLLEIHHAPAERLQMLPDPSGDSIWIRGMQSDLDEIRRLLVELDVAPPPTILHAIELKNQKPSFVVSMLRAYDEGEAVQAPVPQAAPATPGQPQQSSGRKKKQGGAKASAVSKFTPDDDANKLYALCTEAEWALYLPLIEQLDALGADGSPLFVRIELRNIPPETAIDRLLSLVPSVDPTTRVRFAPADRSILVFGSTVERIADIRTLLAEIDKPPDVEERTFVILHADPGDIENAIHELIGNAPVRAKPRRPSKNEALAGGEPPQPVTMPTGVVPTKELTIVSLDNRLIVRTAPDTMQRVAELIAELDVPDTEVRVYDGFPLNADLEGMADKLSLMLAPKSGVAVAGVGKRGPDVSSGATFVPQAAAGKLVAMAPTHLFPQIERCLEVLRAGFEGVEPIVVEFVHLEFADDPQAVVDIVEPLLNMKVRELVDSGEVTLIPTDTPTPGDAGRTSPGGRRKAQPAVRAARYHMEADTAHRSIAIAAPPKIIEQAKALISEFDKPADDKMTTRIVKVRNSDAEDVAGAVREMMGGPRISKKAGERSAKSAAPPPVTGASETPDFTITVIPGGSVVLRGMPADIEEASRWIEQIDTAAGPNRIIKFYQIQHADINQLMDIIMSVTEAPSKPAAAPSGKKAAGAKSSDALDEEEETDWDPVKTRVGTDVYIQADTIAKTMIVAASPAKIVQIDGIVAQCDRSPDEGGIERPSVVPKFVYELKHTDAYDAEFDLGMVLEAMWDPSNKLPEVDEAPFGEALIVRYSDADRFKEIEELIIKYVDVPKKPGKTVIKPVAPPRGMNAHDAAYWIKMQYPDLDIDVIDVTPVKESENGIERIKPAKPQASAHPLVLPLALARMAAALAVQPPDEQEDKPDEPAAQAQEQEADDAGDAAAIEQAMHSAVQQIVPSTPSRSAASEVQTAKSTEDERSKGKSGARPRGKVTIRFDNERGVLVLEGEEDVVEKAPNWMKDLAKEIDELPEKPDIRIYRVKHIDLNFAAEIISEMFNTPRAQQQQIVQQQQAAIQRAAQLAQQQARQQQQQQQGKGQEQGQAKGDGKGQDQQAQQAQGIPQLPPMAVRVLANPLDRTLILRADTSQYPEILDLLATIDQPRPIESKFRVFPLQKLNAVDVEELLKEMLGLEPQAAARRRATAQGAQGVQQPGAAIGSGSALPEPIMQKMMTGAGDLGVDPKDIKISSNVDANSIIVMAPTAALDYVGKLIEDLESQNVPDRLSKQYALQHADVADVADYLTRSYEESGAARTGGAGRNRGGERTAASPKPLNTPTFVAYAPLNMLSVQATQEQIAEIDAMIEMLDVPSPEDEFKTIKLAHADARLVADTLTSMFGEVTPRGGGGPRGQAPTGSASSPKFIGEEGGRILFFSAPQSMHERIHTVVREIEDQSKINQNPRVIKLANALPSDVADAIESAYGAGGGRRTAPGGRPRTPSAPSGSPNARFTVTPHDASKQLFVVADDEMFGRIESLAQTLDKPRDIGFELRIFPLQYASAKVVHKTMTKLVTDFIQRMGANRGNIEPFSVEVDEKANALVVVGGPVVFGFVENALKTVDIPANQQSPPASLVITLKNSDAQEVAGNIGRLWAEKNLPQGVAPPQVEANRATNTLIVRGTQAQIDEINKDVIDPLEQQVAPVLVTKNYTVKNADATVVANIVTAWGRARAPTGGQGGSAALRDTVMAVAEPATQTVVVSASEANQKLVGEMISGLDGETVQQEVHVVQLANADATALAQTLTEIFIRSAPRQGGAVPISISAVAGSKAILVKSKAEDYAKIQAAITQLDSEEVAAGEEVRVVQIQYGDATEMHTAMQEYLRKPGGPGGRGVGGALVGDVRLSVLPQGNALVISGDKAEVDRLEATIKGMDTVGKTSSEPQLIVLKNAKVGQVLPILQEMFSEQRGASRGRNQPPPVITGIDAINAIAVKASPTDLTAIQSTIAGLDIDDIRISEQFKIIQMAQGVDVTDLAGKIEETVNEGVRATMGGGRGADVPQIRVTPDIRTGAIIVAGSPTLFDQAEALATGLEKIGPTGGTTIRMVSSPNVEADEIQRLIDRLTDRESGGGGRRTSSGSGRGGSSTSRPRSSAPSQAAPPSRPSSQSPPTRPPQRTPARPQPTPPK